ncbi:MAG: UDP-3-O-(3-hydroxymyristoyl)glucosamine N-acyltransferase [Thermodesulfobacteriota bacterium]
MEATLAEISRIVGATLRGNPETVITGVAPFDKAGENELTCAANVKFLKRLAETGAGVVIVPEKAPESDRNLLLALNPMVAFARAIAFFHPEPAPRGISPRAVIGKNFSCGHDAYIGPGVVIGDNVTVGDRVRLYPNAVLGDFVRLGDDAHIHPNASILNRCIVGSRVVVHAGTVIGSDGFGFAPDGETYVKIPQTGIVRVGDDVEIGANNTIDRATFGETIIGSGVKTDNLVHVAHNCVIGDNTVLVAQVGISGSVTVGRHAILAGQAGITGHIEIGDFAMIGPQAGVAHSVKPCEIVSGSPAIPHRQWLKAANTFSRLPEISRQVAALQRQVAELSREDED